MTDFQIQPQHLYIHWPFCSFKCHYCDFVAYQEHAAFQEKYHAALLNEIDVFAHNTPIAHTWPLKTIFIGGGTPSLYPDKWIVQLFKKLDDHFDSSSCQEISLEANPADITEEKLETWESCGVNRLSIGVQALNDDVLMKLNRRQRATDVSRAMKIGPKYIKNLSIDLILGLPGISPDEWIKTINTVCQWPINHISIYFLT
ncbi:MAG: radical SAM protein, partial [Chlamydiae bacterium]|nr:radical SAM protein [Chlamydiota bacterium]